jgi:hypothetical protein
MLLVRNFERIGGQPNCGRSRQHSLMPMALAMVNVMDILALNFSAQALGDKEHCCEGGFAFVICTIRAQN